VCVFVLCLCVCVCVCACVCVSFLMCGCFGNMYTVLWLRFFLIWLRFFLPWQRFFLPWQVFPCFFLSCKANATVKYAKTGHGPHSSTLVCLCVFRLLFVFFCVLFVCKCVLPPGDNPIAVNKYINIISYYIISNHIISYQTISYHIKPYHIKPYHISYQTISSYQTKSYLIKPYHNISNLIISNQTISYHIKPYHIISNHIISYQTISYHIKPYHIKPYHIKPYHIISNHIISYQTSSGLHVQYCCYSCQILMKLEFSRQIFKKYWNIKFHEIHSVAAELFLTDGRTDGRDKSNSRFSQSCEKRQRNHTARRFVQDIKNIRRYELDTFWNKYIEVNRVLLLILSYIYLHGLPASITK
jgi:hypothetical protein